MLRAIDEGSASIVNLLLSRGALPYKKGVVSDMLLNRRYFLIPPVLSMKVNYDEVTPLKLARNRKKGSNETIHSAIIAAMVSGSMLIYLCNTWPFIVKLSYEPIDIVFYGLFTWNRDRGIGYEICSTL